MNILCLNLLSVNQNMIQHFIILSIKNNAWIHAEKKNYTKGDTGVTLSNPYDYLLKCMFVCHSIPFRPVFHPNNFFKVPYLSELPHCKNICTVLCKMYLTPLVKYYK